MSVTVLGVDTDVYLQQDVQRPEDIDNDDTSAETERMGELSVVEQDMAIDASELDTKTTVEPTRDPPDGYTWWHVDTGANSMVTNRLNDLISPIAINAIAKTAQRGEGAQVTAIGEIQLSAIDVDNKQFRYRGQNASHVPSFNRQSFSGHEMRRFGWRFIHDVGVCVKLLAPATTQWIVLKVHTEYETDFVALKVEHDASQSNETREKLIACAINLAKTLGGHSLAQLWNLRFGCIWMNTLKEMCRQKKCEGLPISLNVPDNFACPICDITNAKAVAKNPRVPNPIAMKGARWGCLLYTSPSPRD